MAQLSTLKSATNLRDVAKLLGFQLSALSYILYVKPSSIKYKQFDIPKRSGGTRQICAPLNDLKLLQHRLADLLQTCVEEINRTSNRLDNAKHQDRIAHGFKRGRSIITNARWHRNRRYVFNVDIKDFFGSINFGRVRGYFIANKNFQLASPVATVLAQIACFKNSLPQGSPCSPIISNLIGHILDIRLAKLADWVGCTYTRYADDLTFSTNKAIFPVQIATEICGTENSWQPGDELANLIEKCGFALNPTKTRMQYRDSRQEVTGLVVNSKINVRREYRHVVRAMVHRLFTKGSFDFERRTVDDLGVPMIHGTPGRLMQLHGMLGFIDGLDLFNEKIHPRAKDLRLTNKESIYRRFLMFKEFYATASPVVLCEGKTDNVYIPHAIRSLAPRYPELADVKPDGKISIKLRRFRYTNTSTGRILGIHGGSGDLGHFIWTYKADRLRFKIPGSTWPIILLVDNDSGKGKIFSIIKEITKNAPRDSDPYTHIFGNLYLVTTPLMQGAKQSIIEDCFDTSLKSTVINGKTFSVANNFNHETNYGKSDFAYKVVRPNADSIDFSGFQPLLDRFVGVLNASAASSEDGAGGRAADRG
jgi:RNA-directed DNA polymerase